MDTKETITGATSPEAPIITWCKGMEPLGNAVCVMGVFDGVHRGHQYLLARTLADAQQRQAPAWILTFDLDPQEVLSPDVLPQKLLSDSDRLHLLSQTGVDGVLVVPFTAELAMMAPDEFCEQVIKPAITIEAMHVGVDFRYGAKAEGDTKTMQAWLQAQGGTLAAHELLDDDGQHITSTRIRRLLNNCDTEKAAQLLARPFYLKGMVVEGRKVGRSLGVPTANLRADYPAATLGDGGYACYADVRGVRYRAATSVGAPTTFGVFESTIEPHILDFEGDIYGEEIVISFVDYLRPMKTFDSVDELKDAIMADINWIRENIPL